MLNIIDTNTITKEDVDKQIRRIIEILGDSKRFEDEWNEGELEEDIRSLLDQLETEVGFSKELETLYDACMANQTVNESIDQYLAFSNILSRLSENYSDEDIERFLQPFTEDPIKTIDFLLKVTNLFVLFGRISLAVKLCESVFERVSKCDRFFSNPEVQLANVIFCSELQKMLISLQSGNALNWKDFDNVVSRYGFDLDESKYFRFEELLLGKIDSEKIKKQFKKEFSPALWDIQICFCSYMWNEKKIHFSASEILSSFVLNFLASQVKSKNCGVDKFFKFSEAGLEKQVVSLMGMMLPCLEDGFALVWGLPMLYKYLNTIGLIDNESLVIADKIAQSIKDKLISNLPNYRKIYHFVDIIG